MRGVAGGSSAQCQDSGRRKTLAALPSTTTQDFSPAPGTLAGAEAVHFSPAPVVGLKGSLHRETVRVVRLAAMRWDPQQGPYRRVNSATFEAWAHFCPHAIREVTSWSGTASSHGSVPSFRPNRAALLRSSCWTDDHRFFFVLFRLFIVFVKIYLFLFYYRFREGSRRHRCAPSGAMLYCPRSPALSLIASRKHYAALCCNFPW